MRLISHILQPVAHNRCTQTAPACSNHWRACASLTFPLPHPPPTPKNLPTKQLIQSQQSRARRHLFLAERAAFRIPRTPAAPPKVQSVGVIGAGTMGAGIAIAFLFAGFKVTLVDAKQVCFSRGWDECWLSECWMVLAPHRLACSLFCEPRGEIGFLARKGYAGVWVLLRDRTG